MFGSRFNFRPMSPMSLQCWLYSLIQLVLSICKHQIHTDTIYLNKLSCAMAHHLSRLADERERQNIYTKINTTQTSHRTLNKIEIIIWHQLPMSLDVVYDLFSGSKRLISVCCVIVPNLNPLFYLRNKFNFRNLSFHTHLAHVTSIGAIPFSPPTSPTLVW